MTIILLTLTQEFESLKKPLKVAFLFIV